LREDCRIEPWRLWNDWLEKMENRCLVARLLMLSPRFVSATINSLIKPVYQYNVCFCVCVRLSVCLYVCPRAYFRNNTRDLYQFFVYVARSSSGVVTPRGAGVPPFRLCSSLLHSLSHLLLFITFSLFPFLIHFTYFLLLSIRSLSTRIVPLRFQE